MAQTPVTGTDFRVLVQELPPFAFNRRGTPEGYVPEVLAALGTELGMKGPPPMEFTPLPRGVDMLRTHPNVLFGPIARVTANERDFNWVGPLARNRVLVFRRPAPGPMPDLAAVKAARRLAVGRGGGHEALVTELGFTNLALYRSQVDGLRALVAGQVDYAVVSDLAIGPVLEELKLKPAQVQNIGVVLGESEVFFAVSRSADARTLGDWQTALDRLRRDGRLESLTRQHLGAQALPAR